ncbi:MAG TPA: DUF393 domain-containing protein, partial [Arenimonas sp.]|nr:DUF393 domain-containing protein [Arenimonas sp.]
MNTAWPLTIYYDASCPLCAREMHALAAHDANARLRLVDCSPPSFADAECAAAGIGREALMQAIHARDGEGRWHRGIAVFELAYRGAGIEGIAALWAHPWLRPIWERAYPWVALHRMGLSRLGFSRPFGWLVAMLARRAQRRARACRDGRCE